MRRIRRNRQPKLRQVLAVILMITTAISHVTAQAPLTSFRATKDGMPVANGQLFGDRLDIIRLSEWVDDASLELEFADGSRDFAFLRTQDGALEVTTIDHGTEPISDFLRRNGILENTVAINSPCELLDEDHPRFDMRCEAYDPKYFPADHDDIGGMPCSSCHAPGELEASLEAVQAVSLPIATSAMLGPDLDVPRGHPNVEGILCSTCHFTTGAPIKLKTTSKNASQTLPPGHPEVGNTPCSTCHGTAEAPGSDSPSSGGTDDGTSGFNPGDPLPAGHPEIGDTPCSTCHGSSSAPGDDDTTDGDTRDPRLPADHPEIGDTPCTSCHSSNNPGDDDYDDDRESSEDGSRDSRLPSDHPEIGNTPCTSCHSSNNPGDDGYYDDDQHDHDGDDDDHDDDDDDDHHDREAWRDDDDDDDDHDDDD